jgi:hypothetical protein
MQQVQAVSVPVLSAQVLLPGSVLPVPELSVLALLKVQAVSAPVMLQATALPVPVMLQMQTMLP